MPMTTMGRSQFLLNRSKQRFRAQHGGSSDPPMGSIHGDISRASSSKGRGGSERSPSPAPPPLPISVSASTPSDPEEATPNEVAFTRSVQRQQTESTSTSPQQQQQHHQHHQQQTQQFDNDSYQQVQEKDFGKQETSNDTHGYVAEEDFDDKSSLQYSRQTAVSKAFLIDGKTLQQKLEQQQYEHEQQQIKLRQEQLKQQEQLRWQQHQLFAQQEQLQQQEKARQMRQQQQIRHQKHHHQQRHNYQQQQRHLKDQDQSLEQQYFQQHNQQQYDGHSQQITGMPASPKQPEEKPPLMSLKEKRRLRKQEKGSRIIVGKGCWRRHQQILMQQHTNKGYDEDSLIDDLQKTITVNRHGDISNDVADTATVFTAVSQTGSVPNEFVPSRGVILDVRVMSDALSFLDKANRFQIPEHLANTLEPTYGGFPQRGTDNYHHNEDMMRKAIANRQENQKHGDATRAYMEPGHNLRSTQLTTTALSISSSGHSGRSLAQNSTITSRRDAFEEESRFVDASLLEINPRLRDPAMVTTSYYNSGILSQEDFVGSTANGTHLNGLAVPGVETEPSMLSNAIPLHHENMSAMAGTPRHRNREAAASPPATIGDNSYPSLQINEAFTTATPYRKGATTNKMSRRPSPSPSDVLMTYSVTHNEDTTSSSVSGTRDNSDPSGRTADPSGRTASVVSSVHSRRSIPIHKGKKASKAEKIRRKMVEGDKYERSARADTSRCSSQVESSGSCEDNSHAPRYDERDIYENSHGSNSISSSFDSRLGEHERDSLGPAILSNDYSDAPSLPSRRTVDEYRRSTTYTKGRDHISEEHDNATSYSVSQADDREEEYMSPGGHYYQRRDPLADYEDNVSLSVSSRRDGVSTNSRKSYFTSQSFVANDDPSMTPSESSEGFVLDPVSTSYRRQHQSRYPQRSPGRPVQRSDPPPRARKQKHEKKPRKTRKQRYAPVGIPKGNKGAGIILEHQDSNETDFSELDRWLESAMASKSIEEERSIANSTQEDLDAWLDSVIHR